jgi:TPP-dependent pyruvate/acetoin dehydrogenase alpha subunit
MNIGTFRESMNLAQLRQLPVVFVCENNHWGGLPRSDHSPPAGELAGWMYG